nr:hypothetical protein [uncultured Flavobacterium sp.]
MKKILALLTIALLGNFATAQTNDSIPEVEEIDIQETVYKYIGRTVKDTVVSYHTRTNVMLRAGIVNLASDNQFTNSEFGYMRSSGFEWGVTQRRPFSKKDNLLGIKYGITFSYNSVAATDNRVFQVNGNQTELVTYDKELRKAHSYFRNSYINIPIALDFDFSTKEYNHANRKFIWKDGVNFGLGGYVAYNINSKQFISYKEDGFTNTIKQHGNWNVNDFDYGLMAYVGTKNFKIYGKYGLAPVFKNNTIDQKYWSLGLQIEL